MLCRLTRTPSRQPFAAIAAVMLTLCLGGCFTQTFQRGYQIPENAVEQLPVGSSQDQVLIVLGTPSTVATLNGDVFYYISQKQERVAFLDAKPSDQRVLAVYFDRNRRVDRIAHYGMQDGKVFDFIRHTTTSGGTEQTFLRQILSAGN